MRTPALILTVIAVALLTAPSNSQDNVNPSRTEQMEESAKKVKELQKERIATLKAMAQLIANQHRNGLASFDDVCEARLLLLNAELDAAEKDSDRVTLCKYIVDALKEYELAAEKTAKSTGGSASSFLKLKARRLEAEIRLEEAKGKEAKESKKA